MVAVADGRFGGASGIVAGFSGNSDDSFGIAYVHEWSDEVGPMVIICLLVYGAGNAQIW